MIRIIPDTRECTREAQDFDPGRRSRSRRRLQHHALAEDNSESRSRKAGSTRSTCAARRTAAARCQCVPGDHDWFRIRLIEGETYAISLPGGGQRVRDPDRPLRRPPQLRRKRDCIRRRRQRHAGLAACVHRRGDRQLLHRRTRAGRKTRNLRVERGRGGPVAVDVSYASGKAVATAVNAEGADVGAGTRTSAGHGVFGAAISATASAALST